MDYHGMKSNEQAKRDQKALLPSEKAEAMALYEWATLKQIPLVHHCNEGKRHPFEGRNLKRMGLSPGYPDFSLSRAHGGYFGLYIELKRRKEYSPSEMNTPSWRAQSAWLTELANEHYYALRCYGWEKAKQVIEDYLSWPRTIFHPMKNLYYLHDISS